MQKTLAYTNSDAGNFRVSCGTDKISWVMLGQLILSLLKDSA